MAFFAVAVNGIAAQEVTDSRTPIPTAVRQQSLRKQLDEAIGLSKATTVLKKQQAVRELLKMAADSATPPEELYVVLQAALPLIRETGDHSGMRTALQKLTETFQVDPVTEPAKHWEELITGLKSPSTMEAAVKEFVSVMDQMTRQNRFRDAHLAIDSVEKSAKKINAKASVALLADSRIALQEREQAYEAWKKTQSVLETDPNDEKANLMVGQWLAVYENDWKAALPLLAKSSDPKWQAAAEADRSASIDFESRLAKADAWWEVAQAASGTVKLEVQRRVLDSYAELEAEITSPLVKARVTRRMAELAANPALATKLKSNSDVESSSKKLIASTVDKSMEKMALPIDESIDLLAMVKLPEHAILRKWQRIEGFIASESASEARFMVPVVVAGNYQITCKFKRRAGNESLSIIFPVGDNCSVLMIDGWSGSVCGLREVDGKDIRDRVSTGSAVRRKEPLTNGVSHTIQIAVSQQPQTATIQVTLDSERIVNWKGNSSQLGIHPLQAMPNPHAIGIVAYQCDVDICELKLQLNPKGRAYRLGQDWKNPLYFVAEKPTPEVAAKCLDFDGKKYYLSPKPMLLTEAQLLATQLKGRLLTISSYEEEKFIREKGRGMAIWMAGWCATDRKWRDERNRPLRYFGSWDPGQPDNHGGSQNQLQIVMRGGPGWDDTYMYSSGLHACIEWGEEYPEDEQPGPK